MPNLTISFTPASPAPALGYRVKYWNVSTPGSITTVSPNPSGSPVVISGVAAGCYAGTIESACSGGTFSSPVSFNACSPSSNGTISIINNGGLGAEIVDFQPAWFFIQAGSIPVQNLGTADGGHGGFTGNFGVTITGAMGGCLLLSVNNAIVDTIGISASGIYTFTNVSIPPNASVIISLDQGACQ